MEFQQLGKEVVFRFQNHLFRKIDAKTALDLAFLCEVTKVKHWIWADGKTMSFDSDCIVSILLDTAETAY